MKGILAGLFVIVMLVSVSAGAATGEVSIFPVKDIRPGMKGIAYSVYQGTVPEEVPLEVVGVVKNMWGPHQDIILIRLGGRFAKTGVASGMSGSPVYIDGKWVGAISLRIGEFPTEPLGGVTPAESMMEIRETDRGGGQGGGETSIASGFEPENQNPNQGNSPASESASVSDRMMAAMSNLIPPFARAASPSSGYATPIETPLIFSGFSRPVMDFFSPLFDHMGLAAIQGGADSGDSAMASAEEIKTALPPGSAVGAMLATGDLSLGATGTVTYNDGKRILAFGHPFFGLGPIEMPMTKAEIVTTLGSSLTPFKIANITQVVGTVVQDRHSGIMGVLGQRARMIPVTVTMRGEGRNLAYHYQVFENPQWTPMIMTLTFFNLLSLNNWVATPTSFKVEGSAQIKGYPDLALNSLSATPVGTQMPAGFAVANWLGQRFGQIFSNRFERPEISSLNLTVDLIPELRSATIENVWSSASEVHPGDEVPVKISLRPYRGERITRDATIKIPANAAKGNLKILFSDADAASLQSQERLALAQNRVKGLREIIENLNHQKNNQEIYVTILEPTPTAFYGDKLLPNIPSSVANVMDSARAANRLTQVSETAIDQFSIPLGVVVTGGQSLNLNVN